MNNFKSETNLYQLSIWFLRALTCLALLNFVSGCANQSSNASTGVDLATASDETEGQKRAKIRLELAVGYLDQGQTNIALDEVKLAIAANPRSAEALSLRGLIYMRLNDFGLARDSFTRAIAISPRDGNILHNLGWLSCQESRLPDAIINFDKALASPNYNGQAKTYLAKGVCLLRSGDVQQAETNFTRSFELDAGNPITTFNLANLLYKRNDLVRAQFYIRRLNNNEYVNAESLWLAIKIEKKLNNSQGVFQFSERLRKQFPTSKEFGLFERGSFND